MGTRRRARAPFKPFAPLLRRPLAALCVSLAILAAACGPTIRAPEGTEAAGTTTGTDSTGSSALDLPGSGSGSATGSTSGSGTGSGSGFSGSTGTGTSSGSGGPGSGTDVTGPGGSGGTGPVDSDKAPIKVGFILVKQEAANQMAAAAGVSFIDQGEPEQQVKAVVDYINAHGGIAGHKLVAVNVYRDPSEEEADEEARCRHLTEDEHVFAVVDNGGADPDCFAKHATLVLGDRAFDRTTLDKDAPFIWDPGLPYQEAGYAALIDSLYHQGWFKGDVKVGIGAWDDPGTHNAFDDVVKPLIRKYYKGLVDIQYVDTTGNNYSQESQSMAVRFNSEGINRVMFMAPGAGVPLFFMQAARGQAYYPKYGLSTYDNPILLMTAHQTDQLNGSIGAGWDTAIDIDDQHGPPYPQGPAEQQCDSAMRRKHAQRPSRAAAIYAGYICDGAFMLKVAAEMVNGPLTTVSWAAAADKLQDRFQSTWTFPGTTYFEPGRRAGSVTYRYLAYNLNCQCFVYTSGPKPDPM